MHEKPVLTAHAQKSHFKAHVDVSVGQESKKEGKDQDSIQSSTTPDPGYQ